MKLQHLLIPLFLGGALVTGAQLHWTELEVICPCQLNSQDGQTATLEFGLKNHTTREIADLNATLGIVGSLTDADGEEIDSAFVDTIHDLPSIEPNGELERTSYNIDLGQMPTGKLYFQLVIHTGAAEDIEFDSIRDTVWFNGEVTSPPASLNLVHMDFLLDTDGDGVGDMNEAIEATDPNDPNSVPEAPVIDVLLIYHVDAVEHLNTSNSLHAAHIMAVTEYFYKKSESELRLRTVGLVDDSSLEELRDSEAEVLGAISENTRARLESDYRPDLILVFRNGGPGSGLCGIAETITGWGDKGFILPNEAGTYTEVYINPDICSTSTTAHELGHLFGLGHSFNQGSVGTFAWSRGHGVEAEFATIMTYAYSAYLAAEVDVLSNPGLDCHGKPCGAAHSEEDHAPSANAALSVNVTKYQFANLLHPNPSFDIDGDSYGADIDVFPLDASEWADTDGDGYGDNSDAFSDDPLEWQDTDGDGIGDNSDPDIDNDGVLNLLDTHPFDRQNTSIRLLEIKSDRLDDDFGRTVVRVNDLNGDQVADLAVAAPLNTNPSEVQSGTVYLFSFTDFVAESGGRETIHGKRSLAELRSASDTWQLHGVKKDGQLGSHLMLWNHVGGDTATELVMVGSELIYIIGLNTQSLADLDRADGEVDQQIDLDQCVSNSNCSQFAIGADFFVKGLTHIEDLDGDGLTDIGIIGVNKEETQMSFFVLTYQGIQAAISAAADNPPSITQIWDTDESSFVITSAAIYGLVNLIDLGHVNLGIERGPRHELALSLEGTAEPGDVNEYGRTYILSTDQFLRIGLFDTDGDRRIDIDALVSLVGGRRITSAFDDGFGRALDRVSDIDGDGLSDIFIWGDTGINYLLGINAIVAMDIVDNNIDGSVTITDNAHLTQNIWRFNRIGARLDPAQQKILRVDGVGNLADLMVVRWSNAYIVAPLADLDYLDDPARIELNSVINIPIRQRYPDIYQITFPLGPLGNPAFSGITSLGDLDQDGKLDFAITLHSEEELGQLSSIHVIYSATLPVLDELDHAADHIVSVADDYDDTDGDGTPNFHDADDDNDGLPDYIDSYPLIADYQYDADFDGVPNKLDAFPTDSREQFDTDLDGIGDSKDEDLDGDGIPNDDDEFPFDTDNDGIDNRRDLDDDADGILDADDEHLIDSDNDGLTNPIDLDDDADGINDVDDAFPFDTDNDGMRNDVDLDDDGDGTLDTEDAFPLDPTEVLDTDGDGVGDNADVFDDDPNEWYDTDEDGIGNNADLDDDNDGYADVDDAFPLDPTEWVDTDGDGYGDNSDQFPTNPLEWEDLDGDGLGDNLGISGFASYRLVTPWFQNPISNMLAVAATETAFAGDIDGDQRDDLVVSNARSDLASQPTYIVSSQDWEVMDQADGLKDNSIRMRRIAEGQQSWELRYLNRGAPSLKQNNGAVGDMNGDGFLDFVISSPYENSFRGASFLVYGNDLEGKDAADGTTDGSIDYLTCVRQRNCGLVRSEEDFHALSLSNTLVRNYFGENEMSLVMSTYSSERRSPLAAGVGTAFILSHDAIQAAAGAAVNTEVTLEDVLAHDQTYAIYPEFAAAIPLLGDGVSTVLRIPDIDQDGKHEIVLSEPAISGNSFPRNYFIASSDLAAADAADSASDGAIDLQHTYKQPSSYRLDGYVVHALNSNGVAPVDGSMSAQAGSDFIGLVDDGSTPTETYLVDLSRLSVHDSEDGVVDGVIEDLDLSTDANAWHFRGLTGIQLCGVNPATNTHRALVSLSETLADDSIEIELFSVSLANLAVMDRRDGQADQTISLTSLVDDDLEDHWKIGLGYLGESVLSVLLDCGGDLDADGFHDYVISLTHHRNSTTSVRTSVILLLHSDLAVIDELDGTKDRELDISKLWRDDR